MISVAWAQTAEGDSPLDGLGLLLPFVLVFVVFYFLLIRPQQKKVKAHQAKLSVIAKGDDIVTGGGFYGRVVKVEGDDLVVRLGEGLEVRILRSTVMDKLEKGGSPLKKGGGKGGGKGVEKKGKRVKSEVKQEAVQKEAQVEAQEEKKEEVLEEKPKKRGRPKKKDTSTKGE